MAKIVRIMLLSLARFENSRIYTIELSSGKSFPLVLILKCRESEDKAPSVISHDQTVSRKRSQIWPQTKKSGAKNRENQIGRTSNRVFVIEIFAQISLSPLSRHLRVKAAPRKSKSQRKLDLYFKSRAPYKSKFYQKLDLYFKIRPKKPL